MAKTKDETPDTGAASRENMLLDQLIEMQEQIDQLKSGQTAVIAKGQTDAEKLQSELDAEGLALADEFKTFSGIQVLARRADHGVEASHEIRFTDGDPPVHDDPTGAKRMWQPRWFNFDKDGRAFEANARGWEKCRVEMLRDPESIAGAVNSADGYVRRGDRGQEWLMRMPAKWYRFVKKKEQLLREGKLSSESSTQNYLANQVAAMAGATGGNADQAGSFVASKGFTVDISEGPTERDQVPV